MARSKGKTTWRQDRNRWPRALNGAIDWVAAHPMSLFGRIAARRLGSPISGTPTSEWPPVKKRVLIAPVNYSGQAQAWARALSREPETSAVNMSVAVPGGFSFEADLIVPPAVYHNDRDWQQRQFSAVARGATHVLIEAEEPPFGRLMDRDTEKQARALLAGGVNVAFIAHGTDIRLPSRHLERATWSHYRSTGVYLPRLERVARDNRILLDRMARPTFVSTPDLLMDVDYANWVPVVVDVKRWATSRGEIPLRLRVAHAPSVANLKGTHLIAPVLEQLASEGVVHWKLVEHTPSREMPAVFAQTDVVLDQFQAGSYGVAAVEAMAAGCIVIGHVLEDVRLEVRRLTGLELPIIEATPRTLETVLRTLLEDASRIAKIRGDGITFVNAVHDGRMSANVLTREWLGRSD